jgi:hypothetical protein
VRRNVEKYFDEGPWDGPGGIPIVFPTERTTERSAPTSTPYSIQAFNSVGAMVGVLRRSEMFVAVLLTFAATESIWSSSRRVAGVDKLTAAMVARVHPESVPRGVLVLRWMGRAAQSHTGQVSEGSGKRLPAGCPPDLRLREATARASTSRERSASRAPSPLV